MTTILFSVILLMGMTVSYAIGDDAEKLAALREENAKLRVMAKRWTVPE